MWEWLSRTAGVVAQHSIFVANKPDLAPALRRRLCDYGRILQLVVDQERHLAPLSSTGSVLLLVFCANDGRVLVWQR